MSDSQKPAPNAERFEALLVGHLDGRLSEPERIEFFQLLADKPQRCDELMAFTWQARLIQSWLQPELSPNAEAAAGSGAESKFEISNSQSPSPTPHPRAASPVLGFLSHTSAALSKPILWSILAAGLAFGGYIALITWGIRDRGPHAPRGGNVGAEGVVATITDSSDARGLAHFPERAPSVDGREENVPVPFMPGDAITPGEPLQITSGLVELKLKQGATLLVEGPARWSIDGDNRAALNQGKLVAKVPHEAIGFTLETPTAKIVDLGTEFGAEVNASGETQVRVIQGAVETRSTKPGAAPVRILANQAVQVSSDGSAPQVVPFDLAPFARLRERFGKEQPPSPVERVVLFSDNFNAREPRLGINPADGDEPGRQGGLLRHLTYTERMLAEDHRPRLDRRAGAADTAAHLHARSSRFSPNVNFKMQAKGRVKFIVSVDIAPPVPSENGKVVDQDWAGLIVGCTTQEVAMSQAGGVGFLIHSYGSFFVYDGTGDGEPLHIPGGNIQPRWEPVKVRVEYVTSGFNRDGPVDFEIFLDDVSRMKFQTRGPLLENYLMLEAMWGELAQEAWFDNLVVASEKQSPMPSQTNP